MSGLHDYKVGKLSSSPYPNSGKPMKRFLVITHPTQPLRPNAPQRPISYEFYSYRNVEMLCADRYKIGLEDVRKVNGRRAHVTIINLTDEKVELQ